MVSLLKQSLLRKKSTKQFGRWIAFLHRHIAYSTVVFLFLSQPVQLFTLHAMIKVNKINFLPPGMSVATECSTAVKLKKKTVYEFHTFRVGTNHRQRSHAALL